VPEAGELLRNEALARTLDYLASAKDPLQAFYKGDVAAEIARFSRDREGLLAREDLAAFETRIEDPVSLRLGDTELFKTGFWSQGPAELQALAILWQHDLAKIGFGTADYCHLLIEAMKLAYADREQYYADPQKTVVPGEILLSEEYTRRRAGLIDLRRANRELRPGDARRNAALLPEDERFVPKDWGAGTVHVDAVDAKGNMASFHAERRVDLVRGSDRAARLPALGAHDDVLPGAGAPSERRRAVQAPAHHADAVDGVPQRQAVDGLRHDGGDNQGQWLLQYYLCVAAFGMSIPEAIEAPRLSSEHTPGFFAPHASEPNRVRIEPRFGAKVLDELRRAATISTSRPTGPKDSSPRRPSRGHRADRSRLRSARLESGVLSELCVLLVRNTKRKIEAPCPSIRCRPASPIP
jgi:gamma-glutamyltranspeptidase/glutathione hydrolase